MSSDKMPSSENLISEPLSVIDSLFGKCAMRVLTQTCQRWNCQESHAPSPFITVASPTPLTASSLPYMLFLSPTLSNEFVVVVGC